MKLHWQLLLVCTSLLILPWSLLKFATELDRNLQFNQIASGNRQVESIRQLLAAHPAQWRALRVRAESQMLLALPSPNDILLDGYAHDWAGYELRAREFRYRDNKTVYPAAEREAASQFSVQAAVRGNRLNLFLRVRDDRLIFHNPASRSIATGDRVLVRVPDKHGNIRRYTFRAEAPGEIVARYLGEAFEGVRPVLEDPEYRGALLETRSGYSVELSIPLPVDGRFGITVEDVDRAGDTPLWTGMFDPQQVDALGQLRMLNPTFSTLLESYTEPGMRIRVFDAQGWLVADEDRRMPDASVRQFSPGSASVLDAILYRFISSSLERAVETEPFPRLAAARLKPEQTAKILDIAGDNRFLRDRYGRVFLVGAQTIESVDGDLFGYLVVQRPRAAMTAYTEQAVLRLMKIFGLSVLLIAAVLIAFAFFLSWRIRRLRNEVEQSVNDEGKVRRLVRVSRARDEIGDLSRSFGEITRRQLGYTDYLQTLGSKLSHELRTPLSVLSTSLESIDPQSLDQRTRDCVERADQGARRLQQLIRNLSEASSLEQTISRAETGPVDLAEWLQAAYSVYPQIYPERQFEIDIADGVSYEIDGSAELLQQMMDKLVSNAADFSTADDHIRFCLAGDGKRVVLAVENTGEYLPQGMTNELFDSMVSQRQARDDQPHMGLGLYVVRLIAEFHGASCRAANLEDARGAVFTIAFPASHT